MRRRARDWWCEQLTYKNVLWKPDVWAVRLPMPPETQTTPSPSGSDQISWETLVSQCLSCQVLGVAMCSEWVPSVTVAALDEGCLGYSTRWSSYHNGWADSSLDKHSPLLEKYCSLVWLLWNNLSNCINYLSLIKCLSMWTNYFLDKHSWSLKMWPRLPPYTTQCTSSVKTSHHRV